MVLPAHNRIIFSGVFGAAPNAYETWSFRLCTGPEVFASQAARLDRLTNIVGAWALRMNPLFRSTTRLTRVRLSQHLEGGLTSQNEEGGYNQADLATNQAGTVTSGEVMPLHVATAVTLQTARSGPSGRGRIFLPTVARSLGTDFRYSVADASGITTAVRGLINDINSYSLAAGSADDVNIISSKGFRSPVISVGCGRIPDTMRSRRADTLEERVMVALA